MKATVWANILEEGQEKGQEKTISDRISDRIKMILEIIKEKPQIIRDNTIFLLGVNKNGTPIQ